MKIEINNLKESWNNWKNKDLKNDFSNQIIIEGSFEYDSVYYEYSLFEYSKNSNNTIYDFICQCYLHIEDDPFDDWDDEEERLKFKHLMAEEFLESINNVFKDQDPKIINAKKKLTDLINLNTSIDIVVIFEWWSWSTYIIEYEDKWQFVILSLNW